MEEQNENLAPEQEYYQQPEETGEWPSPPQREDFDDYDDFTNARIQHELNKVKTRWDKELSAKNQQLTSAIKQGIREATSPPPPPPIPDDPFAAQRTSAKQWEEDCLAKAQEALSNFDYEGHKKWKDRAKWGRDELASLPRPMAEEILEDYSEFTWGRAISKLLNPENEFKAN